ncbi:MAG: FIST C-terminal domain-containing protein [Treponema sp.]|jgi:hypothetical protein|nr:FIST C-terminal domain-containing protein [Treponema sp.]
MIQVAARQNYDINGLIKEIAQPNVKVVIFFFSVEYERFEPHKAIKQAFPQATCIASSMIGGWAPAMAVEKGIIAMSLSSDEVADVFVSFKEGVKSTPDKAAHQAIEELKNKLGYRKVNPHAYLGIVLFDGLCRGDDIMQALTLESTLNMPFVGGAAADELAFAKTLVGLDEKISDDGLVLLIMKMNIPFYCDHFVHYTPRHTAMMVTKVEPKRRIIWEFNNEPAAQYYAKLAGITRIDQLNTTVFESNPLGVSSGGLLYCRAIHSVIDGTGLVCFASVTMGTVVHMLKAGDIIAHTQSALQKVKRYIPDLQGVILFNCVLRLLEMQRLNKIDTFRNIFSGLRFIGFNTYGEELFVHHNQTLTAVFFGGGRGD